MATPKFQNGPDPRRGKGGKRPGAGRPRNEEREFKAVVKEAVTKKLIGMADKLAAHYLKQAFKDNKVLMHAIDRVLPAAKAEVEVSGGVKIIRVVAPKYD